MRNGDVYQAISELKRDGRRGVLATVTGIRGSSPASLGSKMLIIEGEGAAVGTVGGGCVDGMVWAEARHVLRRALPKSIEIDLTDREDDPNHGLICGGVVTIFLEPLVSNPLYICGAGHVGHALARFAALLDFSMTVIDDRESFANAQRFPGARLLVGDFDEVLETVSPAANAAIVIVTRGHRYDELCLRWALSQDCRYTGLIGSKVKIAKLFSRLGAEGASQQRLAQVRAPIGLDIGAVTVEEIALSVAAELVAIRRLESAPSRSLRARLEDAQPVSGAALDKGPTSTAAT